MKELPGQWLWAMHSQGSVVINPAGSAVAKYSQITLTPALSISSSTTQGVSPYTTGELPYFEKQMRSSMTRFGMPNLGLTINWDTNRKSGLKNMSFGFIVNRTATYNEDVYASGTNSSTSFMGSMAYDATVNGYLGTELNADNAYNNMPWKPVVGYQSGMISTFGGYDDQFVGASEIIFDNGEVAVGGPLAQSYGRRVTGSKYDYVFNFGANLSDFLYVGANLGITSLDYGYDEYFKETAVDPADFEIALDNGKYMYFSQMRHRYWYNADVSGIYAKIGAILTPGAGLRIGAAIQTPTTNTVVERWQYSGSTEFTSSEYDGYASSPEGEYTYVVNSPFRANFGVAYTLGSFAVLSADYEYTDYSQIRFMEEHGNSDYFEELNGAIKEIFGPQNIWRFGAEVKLGALALRGGYGFSNSPEKHFEGTYRSNTSFGLGYSSKGSFYADFAVRKNTYSNEYYMPYNDYIFNEDDTIAEPVPEILITRSDWKAILTLGWRF